MNEKKRPRIRVRFKYNTDTGEIEEFIIDDNAPGASEAYHDGIARAIAARLSKHPEIEDAGNLSLTDSPSEVSAVSDRGKENKSERQEHLSSSH
ncbi:hypothetical protein QUF80_09330 [Desulfococcaceae bacterium HSG8]|nr:hypothetical protein [Desulfococcaceae bacterium HSG8]